MTLPSWPWTECCEGIHKLSVAYIPTKTVVTYAPPADQMVIPALRLSFCAASLMLLLLALSLGERVDRDRRFHQPARAG